MIKAKITKEDGFRCAPKGHTVVVFPFGAIVEGDVAKWALEERAGQAMFDLREKTAQAVPPETKESKPKKRGRPPRKG